MTISLEAWENKLRKKNRKLSNKHIERINQEVKGWAKMELDNKARYFLSYLDKPVLQSIWIVEGEDAINYEGHKLRLLIKDLDGFYYLELKTTSEFIPETMTLMTRHSLYQLAHELNDSYIISMTNSFYSKLKDDFDFENEIGGQLMFGQN